MQSVQWEDTGIASIGGNCVTTTPDGTALSLQSNAQTYYYLYAMGKTVVGTANSSGQLAAEYIYDPLGNDDAARQCLPAAAG